MLEDIDEILYSRSVIEERVKELAAQVAAVHRDRPYVVAVMLKGAFVFASDLIRHLPQPIEVAFVRASSYGEGTSPRSEPSLEVPADTTWKGRHVLLVEDIVDTGRSIAAMVEALRERGADPVRVCAFLDKPARREVPVDVEFTGFVLAGDPFVVGYGLDRGERYRNLPFVGTLKPGVR